MTEEQEPTFQIIGDDLPIYYSNLVRVNSTVYDIAILFGARRPAGLVGNAATVDQECIVQMSPAHAKSLMMLLQHQLRLYEEQWGELPVPPDMAERYGEETDAG
jgi:Protein of unknown function (DUF3467)